MKLNRLLEMTLYLLGHSPVTAGELAEHFGVSRRTVYRDIDALSCAGVPVYMKKGNGGGVSLLEGYTIDRTMLSGSESDSLMLALRMLRAAKYPDVTPLFEKLGVLFERKPESDWIEINFEPWEVDPNEKNRFNDLKSAIIGRRVTEFDYVNAQGGPSHRAVEPIRLIFRGQTWYLLAFCRLRQEERVFRVSRVKNVTVTHESFSPRPMSAKTSELMMMVRQPTLLRLRFQPQMLHRVYDTFDGRFMTVNPDGSCTVEIAWPEDEWVYSFILSFGSFVEVLSPAHVREIIIERLRIALGSYSCDK
jgi:predicted DNA-binding transcriptional regulator YafY